MFLKSPPTYPLAGKSIPYSLVFDPHPPTRPQSSRTLRIHPSPTWPQPSSCSPLAAAWDPKTFLRYLHILKLEAVTFAHLLSAPVRTATLNQTLRAKITLKQILWSRWTSRPWLVSISLAPRRLVMPMTNQVTLGPNYHLHSLLNTQPSLPISRSLQPLLWSSCISELLPMSMPPYPQVWLPPPST